MAEPIPEAAGMPANPETFWSEINSHWNCGEQIEDSDGERGKWQIDACIHLRLAESASASA
jgi:hypothetical protein